MKKTISMLLCLGMLLSLFAGCAAEDRPYEPSGDALAAEDADLFATAPRDDSIPQELTLAYFEDRSMNPYIATDFTNRALFSLIYQGLFSVSRKYEAVPLLCQGYRVSSDYKIFTFLLGNDATFSDGSPVTIEDVQASFEAAKKSKFYGARFDHVIKTAISDDGGMTFYLTTPIEDFPLLMDFPIIKASEIEADHPLGTGPYIYEISLAGAHLRRNTAWWCSSPDLLITAGSITLVAAEGHTHIRDEFEFADVGIVCADPCADSYADYRCDYELWTNDTGVFLFIGCNVAYSQEEIFETDELRKILTYAIDRKKIAEDVYNGFGRPTTLAMDPEYPYYSASLAAKYEYDPEKFKELLSTVDLPKEPLLFLVNSDDSMRLRAARQIANMFAECGMEVQISELSTNAFRREISLGRYDIYLGQTRLSSTMDLSPFFRPYGPLSYGSIDNEVLYDLCKDALDNHGNFYDLHKALAEDGRIVPILFSGHAIYATRGLVSDLQPGRDNIFAYTLGKTLSDILRQPDSVG